MLLTADTLPQGGRRAAREPRRRPFRDWRRARPFVGSLMLVLAGIEMFLSTQLDLGNIKVQMGIEGFQAVLIPAGLALLGLLAMFMPVHHVFYGVLALVVAVYSLIGVNLGGFFVGMLLGAVGGTIVVAWGPRAAKAEATAEETVNAELVADGEPVHAEAVILGAPIEQSDKPVALHMTRAMAKQAAAASSARLPGVASGPGHAEPVVLDLSRLPLAKGEERDS